MKVNSTANTERVGVSFVQLAFERIGHIFREQPVSDYGIDAHVEIVKDDNATGRLIAVQIKSGKSWFNEESENGFIFREDLAHLDYWLNHSLSVIVVLCDPDTETAYWQVVNNDNISVTGKGWKMEIPASQTITDEFKERFEELAGQPITITDKYTVLSFRDVSHGRAKRYSANILVPESFGETEIYEVIREVTENLKHREYYRNEIIRQRWRGKHANVIFLYVYRTIDDVRTTSWVFSSLWIDENLPPEFAPFRRSGGVDIGDNIVVHESQHYELMQKIREQHSIDKEDYLSALEEIRTQVEKIVERAIDLTDSYTSNILNSETYLKEMTELEPNLTELYIQSGDIGLAPLECQDLSDRFQSLMGYAHNIVLPFSERGLKTWEEPNRNYLVQRAIESYQQDKMRLEFELEKVH